MFFQVKDMRDKEEAAAQVTSPPYYDLRILLYLVIYDSWKVSLGHLLLSRNPPQSVEQTNPESIIMLIIVMIIKMVDSCCRNPEF